MVEILEAKVVLPAIQTKHFSEIDEGVKGNEFFVSDDAQCGISCLQVRK